MKIPGGLDPVAAPTRSASLQIPPARGVGLQRPQGDVEDGLRRSLAQAGAVRESFSPPLDPAPRDPLVHLEGPLFRPAPALPDTPDDTSVPAPTNPSFPPDLAWDLSLPDACVGSTETATIGGNEVTWSLDDAGRPWFVEATLVEDFSGLPRSREELAAQAEARGRGIEGDAGGHVIGHRFVADQGLRNLFPQNTHFNNSAYRTMENEWAAWLDHGMEVEVEVELLPADQDRPDEVAVSYRVLDPATGRVVYDNNVLFQNEAGQRFERVPTRAMADYAA